MEEGEVVFDEEGEEEFVDEDEVEDKGNEEEVVDDYFKVIFGWWLGEFLDFVLEI